MPIPDLTIHDINVADHTFFTNTGAVATQRKVTYSIGTHGPFTLTYDKADATPERIKQDIRQHVKELTDIHELTG
jgi:hypothetical protein